MDEKQLPPGTRRMVAAAATANLPVELRPRPPAERLEQAAEMLGIRPADIAKTLVVRRSTDAYLFAVVAGDGQMAWPKLRAAVGVNKLAAQVSVPSSRSTTWFEPSTPPLPTSPAEPVRGQP